MDWPGSGSLKHRRTSGHVIYLTAPGAGCPPVSPCFCHFLIIHSFADLLHRHSSLVPLLLLCHISLTDLNQDRKDEHYPLVHLRPLNTDLPSQWMRIYGTPRLAWSPASNLQVNARDSPLTPYVFTFSPYGKICPLFSTYGKIWPLFFYSFL
jgi:hypothetical protein